MKSWKKPISWALTFIMVVGMLVPPAAHASDTQLPDSGILLEDFTAPHTEYDSASPAAPVPPAEMPQEPAEPDVIPFIDLVPAEATANEIPLIDLVPAEEFTGDIPLTELIPAEAVPEDIPLTELAPADPADPNAKQELGQNHDDIDGDFDIDITTSGLKINYIGQVHSVIDPEYPNEPIILYCMNNQRHWPHSTPDTPDVPNYTDGYLTPDDFDSPEAYSECMRKMRKILYAGYPYNAERLYKIVDSSERYVPTEEEFNEMLLPLPHLIEVFPELGHHVFSVKDKHDPTHLAVLQRFISGVDALKNGGSTANGLTYKDITSMPFYKAAKSLMWQSDNPMEAFAYLFPDSYFVTHDQAYTSTQYAIWKLLTEYGIEDNNIIDVGHDELAQILLQYARHGDMLMTEPEYGKITIQGDLKFTYNEDDGKWYTGELMIVEPKYYHGVYDMQLPEGVTMLNSRLTHVYGNEPYRLVSDREVPNGAMFHGTVNYYWLQDFRQYSPLVNDSSPFQSDTFQNMVGAVIRSKSMKFSVKYGTNKVGNIEISKFISGVQNAPQDYDQEFDFTLTLNNCDIDGKYGDLNFTGGVSHFTLKHGETKLAKNLPADVAYTVTEASSDQYIAEAENSQGVIEAQKTAKVHFNNIMLPKQGTGDILLSKMVEGRPDDLGRDFHFTLTLEDCSITGTYGDLDFVDGVSQFTLRHMESKTAEHLPAGITYTVTETPDDSFRAEILNSTGIIQKDTFVDVAFTNIRIKDLDFGNIVISKEVVGEPDDLTREFPFTLTLSDSDINGSYGDLDFTDGVSHFTLKHGESRTAEYLPAGITYTVTEAPDDSFTVTSENDQGVIEKDQTVTAAFTNTRNGGRPTPPPVIPPVPPVPPERPVIPALPLVPPEKPILPIVPVDPVDPAPETPLVPLLPVVPVTPVDPEQPPETPEAPDPDDTEHSSKDDVKDHTSPDTETLVDTETPAESDAPETAEKTETTEHLPVPQTGDSTNLGFWLIVLAAAFAGFCYPTVKKKRRNVE